MFQVDAPGAGLGVRWSNTARAGRPDRAGEDQAGERATTGAGPGQRRGTARMRASGGARRTQAARDAPDPPSAAAGRPAAPYPTARTLASALFRRRPRHAAEAGGAEAAGAEVGRGAAAGALTAPGRTPPSAPSSTRLGKK